MSNRKHQPHKEDATETEKITDTKPEPKTKEEQKQKEDSKQKQNVKQEIITDSETKDEEVILESESVREEIHQIEDEKKFAMVLLHESKEGPYVSKWITQKTVQHTLLCAAAILFGLICMVIALGVNLSNARKQLSASQLLVEEYEEVFNNALEDKDTLRSQNEELDEKVTILSQTISQMLAEEELEQQDQEKKCTPTGFPVRGTTSIISGNTDALTDNNAQEDSESSSLAVFHVGKGTSIVAAANGVVESISADAEYGKQIVINHGNGYITYYKCKASVKVQEGDEITGGTMILEVEDEDAKFAYQIFLNGKYLNPMSLMEVYG